MRIRTLIVAGITSVVAAVPAAAETKGKCVYWFGICTSCEKPYTCKNSRRTDKSKVGAKATTTKANKSKAKQTTGTKPQKPGPRVARRRIPPPLPVHAARTRQQHASATQTTNFDREFRDFKQFIRLKQLDGEFESNQKLAELYLRFKLWSITRRKSRPKSE